MDFENRVTAQYNNENIKAVDEKSSLVNLDSPPQKKTMFIYLAKKIKLSLGAALDLNAIAWNREHGWIACGGDEGTSLTAKTTF